MGRRRIGGIAFDMYGTLVDVARVADACRDVTPEPGAFVGRWRAKQLEYTFLRSLMGRYLDFWRISEQALQFEIERAGLRVTRDQRRRMMRAWLNPTPYPDAAAALPRLVERRPLAVLSNGSAGMLRIGLARTGLSPYFRWVISAGEVKLYKPSPKVYRLAVQHMRLPKDEILFVSSNPFDVAGAKSFGFSVCWINRTGSPFDPLGRKPDLILSNLEGLGARLS